MAQRADSDTDQPAARGLARLRQVRFAAPRLAGRPGRSDSRLFGWGAFDWLRALLVLAILVQAVRLFWMFVTPVAPLGDWQWRSAVIPSPAARAALFASFDAFDRQAGAVPAQQDSAAVTSLDLTLYGVRLNEASGQGSAIIAGSDGVQKSIKVGEEVVSGVTLAEVQFDHVVLSRSGSRESLYLDQSVPADTVGGGAPVTAPATGASTPPGGAGPALSAQTMGTGINFAPRTENGRITGFLVSPKGEGNTFNAAGFRPGDIVTQINGRSVSSTEDATRLVESIKPGARVSLTVERGTDTLPIAIIIPES